MRVNRQLQRQPRIGRVLRLVVDDAEAPSFENVDAIRLRIDRDEAPLALPLNLEGAFERELEQTLLDAIATARLHGKNAVGYAGTERRTQQLVSFQCCFDG